MYATDNAGLYATSLTALAPNYLMYTVPTCPSVGRDTYSASYKVSARPDRFTVWCGGRNHIQAGEPANYPQYNSDQGLVT
jgi:hypothetical protein